MTDCEQYEALGSALLDDELEQPEVLEIVDHLVRCEGCRRFWAGSRSLDGLLEATGLGPTVAEAPGAVWERLSGEAAPPPPPTQVSTESASTWLWPLAATVALLVGLGFALPEPPALDVAEIELADEVGRMSEERFVELTTELLQADRRYRHAMLEIMEEVEDGPAGREASDEGSGPRSEDGEARSRV